MTPAQKQTLVDTIRFYGPLLVGLGIAWGALTAAVKNKVDHEEFRTHVVGEAQVDSATMRAIEGFTAGACVGETNPYRRVLWHCDAKGIR